MLLGAIHMSYSPVRNRQEIEERLQSVKTELQERFDVCSLSIFGSGGRDTLAADSDIDLIVHFGSPTRFHTYFDLKFFLEDLLGRKIDLITPAMLKPRLKEQIEAELRYVA